MSEVSVVKSRASVMLYNNERKAWEPAEGIRGMSYVQVYHHESNQTYRIVGRSMTDQQQVVINCSIIRNMKYNAATPTFHQWRDQRQVYGLNFHSKDDAAQFKEAIDIALEDLNNASQKPAAAPSHTQQYVSQGNQSWQSRFVSQNSDQSANIQAESARPQQQEVRSQPQEQEKPKSVSSSVSITPAAPQPPVPPSVPQAPVAPAAPAAPAPPTPPVPAAPPAPPGGGGVPAPPPPPPPPPAVGAGGGGGNGGGLAAQIAAAKLKKASAEPAKPSGGGGGSRGGDMMAEMQRKLAARKAKEDGEDMSPRSQVDAKPVAPPPTVNKSSTKINHVPAPPPVNQTPVKSTTSIKQDRGHHGGESQLNSGQLQELKTEILNTFRKELDAAKAEIIQTIRQEISRIR